MIKYFLSLFACLSAGFMTGQLAGIIVEEYSPLNATSTVPQGSTINRVYVLAEDPSNLVTAVFATENCAPIDVSTTSHFYNSALYSVITPVNTNPVFWQMWPTIEADTWITIGADNSTVPGASDFDYSATIPEDPWTNSLDVNFGANLEIQEGSWFVPQTSALAIPSGPDNRVLIGQFTTTGVFSFNLNIEMIIDGVVYRYYWSEIDGCVDGEAVQVYDPDLGLSYSDPTCNDENACNYDPDGLVFDLDACEYLSCAGCTDVEACNFDEMALIDDGSCEYICPGCTDPEAFNFDETANLDDGSCLFSGCGDPFASNFEPYINIEDGSCEYFGCTDEEAWNYNPSATNDNGSCQFDCDGPTIAIIMEDGFGDGWNNAHYVFLDEDNSFAGYGNLDNAEFGDGSTMGYDFKCLPEGTYTVVVGGGSFDQEIATSIECSVDQEVFIDGPGIEVFVVTAGEGCIPGCLDPEADNYDPEATFALECIYLGCIDEEADNYNPMANEDDGSCIYELDGYVFFDSNENGNYDVLIDDPLGGVAVTLQPGGVVLFTDENGYYSFGEMEPSVYVLSIESIEVFPTHTTANPFVTDLLNNGATNIDFGVTNEEPIVDISVSYTSAFEGVPCNNDPDVGWVIVQNTGNQAMSGYVEIHMDPAYQSIYALEFDVSVDENVATIPFQGIPANQSLSIEVNLGGPDVEFIGEMVTNTVYAYAVINDEVVAFDEKSYTDLVVCAYDPNDKQAEPNGYTEEHFILNETPIDYTIRFQNTGNAPAGLVTLVDTLDINFDLNSFDVIGHSHSVLTMLDPSSRELTFTFENIQLPDSASDPEGSIGFVTYRIIPLPELAPNTTLENTAHIFFDSNPAIVTNTYVHTIYECGQEANFAANPGICLGDEFTAVADHPHVTYWNWNYDGEEIGTDSSVVYAPEFTGNFDLTLTAGNPLCETEQSLQIEVYELPEATFTSNGPELTASVGTAWQWYMNGVPIDGATDITYMVVEDGNYSVEVTNDNGCMALSDEAWIQASNISVTQQLQLALYPNPMFTSTELVLPDNGPWTIEIYDLSGQSINETQSISDKTWVIERNDLSAGQYIIHVKREGSTQFAIIELQVK